MDGRVTAGQWERWRDPFGVQLGQERVALLAKRQRPSRSGPELRASPASARARAASSGSQLRVSVSNATGPTTARTSAQSCQGGSVSPESTRLMGSKISGGDSLVVQATAPKSASQQVIQVERRRQGRPL